MQLKIGVVMDPIASIHPYKDTTFAILLAAQKRSWPIYYMEQQHLFLRDNKAWATARELSVRDQTENWFTVSEPLEMDLATFDVILMRKDPPVDMNYIYTTYLLEKAEAAGVLVVNKPQSLRDANEKLFATCFPQCMPPSIVSADKKIVLEFLALQHDIILKPLNAMGGIGVFRVRDGDPNINVIIETLTHDGTQIIMAQRYIPDIKRGDKRIILINGEIIPYALARIPAKGETRANIASGGHGVGVELTTQDLWLCEQIAPTLREKGLNFVGIDVIGDYVTEINVTSPTLVRELEKQFNIDICGQFLDWIGSTISLKGTA